MRSNYLFHAGKLGNWIIQSDQDLGSILVMNKLNCLLNLFYLVSLLRDIGSSADQDQTPKSLLFAYKCSVKTW